MCSLSVELKYECETKNYNKTTHAKQNKTEHTSQKDIYINIIKFGHRKIRLSGSKSQIYCLRNLQIMKLKEGSKAAPWN